MGVSIDPGPSVGTVGQSVWNGKKIALSVIAIVVLLVLYEQAPSLGGPLIFASVFVLLMRGVGKTIHTPGGSITGSDILVWGAALIVVAIALVGMVRK